MRFWLKTSLFLCLYYLSSCSFSSDNESLKTDLDSTIKYASSLDVDTINAENHTKFLSKDGYYQTTWGMLQDVKIEQTYFPKYKTSGYYAEFGASPLFLRDKNIQIEGYMIPYVIDSTSKTTHYFLSYYPNSTCFFCSGNGPETILQLKFDGKHRNFRSDEYLTFRGKLVLNNGNPGLLNYLLYNAKAVE